jgi:CHRD domain
MRPFVFGFVTSLVAVAAITVAQAAFAASAAKTTICHRTISAKKPYIKLTVSKSVLKGHLKHAADIIPAPAGPCPQVVLSPTAGGQALTTNLSGAAEVPGPGDPDGAGTATIRLRLGEGRLCFQLSASNITLPAAAAHIHQGAAGVAGSIVVTLKPPAANGTSSGCVVVPRMLVAQILAGSSGYYVNVHTSDYPNGAIRGQL